MKIDIKEAKKAYNEIVYSVSAGEMTPNTGRLLNELLREALNMRIVSQRSEQLLQAYKDGFQAATDSIVGANEMIKNKTLQ